MMRLLRAAFQAGGDSDEWKAVCMLCDMLDSITEEVELQ
jgi:hypothetical protein